jgi:hypothetical protein
LYKKNLGKATPYVHNKHILHTHHVNISHSYETLPSIPSSSIPTQQEQKESLKGEPSAKKKKKDTLILGPPRRRRTTPVLVTNNNSNKNKSLHYRSKPTSAQEQDKREDTRRTAQPSLRHTESRIPGSHPVNHFGFSLRHSSTFHPNTHTHTHLQPSSQAPKLPTAISPTPPPLAFKAPPWVLQYVPNIY